MFEGLVWARPADSIQFSRISTGILSLSELQTRLPCEIWRMFTYAARRQRPFSQVCSSPPIFMSYIPTVEWLTYAWNPAHRNLDVTLIRSICSTCDQKANDSYPPIVSNARMMQFLDHFSKLQSLKIQSLKWASWLSFLQCLTDMIRAKRQLRHLEFNECRLQRTAFDQPSQKEFNQLMLSTGIQEHVAELYTLKIEVKQDSRFNGQLKLDHLMSLWKVLQPCSTTIEVFHLDIQGPWPVELRLMSILHSDSRFYHIFNFPALTELKLNLGEGFSDFGPLTESTLQNIQKLQLNWHNFDIPGVRKYILWRYRDLRLRGANIGASCPRYWGISRDSLVLNSWRFMRSGTQTTLISIL